MATLLQFSRNIRKLGSRIENNSAALTKRVAKRTLQSLVEGTPVDKGVARSNWRTSLGNPTRSVIPAFSPGRHLGIGERANARAAIQAGFATINQLRVGAKRGTGQAGSAVYITNAIPYLDRLRSGYSSQQPNDWVQVALLEAQAEIASTRLLSPTMGDG
jgi:hypothetical protein